MDDTHAASLRAGRRTEPRLQAGSPSPGPATPSGSSTGSAGIWPTASTSTPAGGRVKFRERRAAPITARRREAGTLDVDRLLTFTGRDRDSAWLCLLGHAQRQGQDARVVVRLDVLRVEGLAEEELPG